MTNVTLSLLVLVLLCKVAFCGSPCKNTDVCKCFPDEPRSGYKLQCFRKDEILGFIINVVQNETVSVECAYGMSMDEISVPNKSADSVALERFNISQLPDINLNGLKEFHMRYCPLPKESFRELTDWFSLENIKVFRFEGSITQNATLTKQYFEGFESVEKLLLNNNKLVNIDEDTFVNTPNLISIDLAENSIILKPDLFASTPLLKSLYLSQNQLEFIPDGLFRHLSQLKILHLWGNNLTFLNDTNFDGLSNLGSLELSANNIDNISKNAFKFLTNLKQINLSKNKLNEVSSELFKENTLLEKVMIRDNINLKLSDYFFTNFPHLQHVDLTNCRLESLPDQIFENSTELQTIILESNNLKDIPKVLFKGLLNLKNIQLQNNKIDTLPNSLFSSLKNLEVLQLQNNLISVIDENVFKDLINLKDINLSRNRISKIHFLAFSNKGLLKSIDLSHNRYIPEAGKELLNNCLKIEDINFSNNLITYIDDVVTINNKVRLRNMDFSYNDISYILLTNLQSVGRKLFIDLSYNNITQVDFTNAEIVGSEDSTDRNNPFSEINISENPLECNCHNYDFLRYFKNELKPKVKETFKISGKNLTCATPSKFEDQQFIKLHPSELTCPMKQLILNYTACPEKCSCDWRPFDKSIVIDCSHKNLTMMPEFFLPHTQTIYHYYWKYNQTEMNLENNKLVMGPSAKLTDYNNVTKLILSHNQIRKLEWIPPKLKVLQLDDNQISTISFEILKTLNTSRLINLTLNNNPWRCECDTVNFTNFLRRHTKQVDANGVHCANDNSIRLIDLNENDLCYQGDFIYIIIPLVFLVIVLLTITLYCTFKQELKIWLFANNLCLWWVTEEEVDKDKVYDIFLSYSHKDEEFMVQNLLPVLEGSYKLCLHYRDWTPGEFITKQVINSVYESRRTLVVLSPNFLESIWGKLEFRTAHTQAMTEGRARVIIVLYGDVDMNKLDNELKAYLKTNTYVEWGDPYFWRKLKYALPHSKINIKNTNQKHVNIMNYIDDKFNLVPQTVTPNPGSTPPVLSLDPNLLKKHPLNFVNNSKVEMDTPPAEGSLLITTNL